MINIGTANKAISLLKSVHPWLYTDMTEPLRLGTAQECVLMEDCVITKVAETWIWAIFSDKSEKEAAEFILSKMDKEDSLCLHSPHGPEKTRKIMGLVEDRVPCYIAVRLSQEPFQIKTDTVLKPLTHEHLEFVIQTYRMAKFYSNPEESFTEALDRGMIGAFVDGQIAGFIGRHTEGAMGMLEVLPNFRRRGLGKALEQKLINDYLSEGKIPYCHILETNAASLALERDLGFLISEESSVYWMN